MRIAILISSLFAVGCAELKVDIDADEDGLLTSEEEALGTDPLEPDSDGDGHLDGDEATGGFNPLDAESHPYKGGYTTIPCEDGVPDGTGYAVGQISPSFELVDQHDEIVTLSDFCGQAVVIETSAFW